MAEVEKVGADGTLQLTVRDALLLGLENNRALRVQRWEPAITRTFEKQEEAVFDPVVSGALSGQHIRSQQIAGTGTGLSNTETTTTDASLSLAKTFSTGTRISLDGAANLAGLRQARLDTLSSIYQLQGYAEALAARIENVYWDYALAERTIAIYTDSLQLAERQLSETRTLIEVGRLGEVELSAAAAEVAARQIGLINARSARDKSRLQLQSLLSPGGPHAFRQTLTLLDQPVMPEPLQGEVSAHLELARRLRPDLNEARLAIQRGDLELVKTRNGLLPRLDLFITLGSSGYAESFAHAARNNNGEFDDVTAGIQFSYPLGNNDAQARHQRAELGQDQATEALANMDQLAEVDVRSAYLELQRAREEAVATAVLVKQRAATAEAEAEKFRVGKSTSLLVAQTQQDLLAGQIRQVDAIVNSLKADIDLYRLEGSLLERLGISAQ